jgi:hypothetical protein
MHDNCEPPSTLKVPVTVTLETQPWGENNMRDAHRYRKRAPTHIVPRGVSAVGNEVRLSELLSVHKHLSLGQQSPAHTA